MAVNGGHAGTKKGPNWGHVISLEVLRDMKSIAAVPLTITRAGVLYFGHFLGEQTRVYPYPLGAGSARPNPKMGTPDSENPLFLEFSVPRRGIETMVSDHGLGRGPDHGVGVDPETVIRESERTPTIKAVRGTVAIKGIFDN